MSLDLLVSLALRDLLALLVSLVRMVLVSLDPRDPPDLLEALAVPSLESLDLQVDLANLATMEHLVRREILEPLALRDPGETLDLLESPDPLDSPLLANLDLQVFQDQWGLEESLV